MTLIPTWVTPAGTLGTIPEGVFYNIPLVATSDSTVRYAVIAGRLPPGVQINETGILAGNPSAISTVQGIPADIVNDTTSQFVVRAYTQQVIAGQTVIDTLADRTFSLTVTGQSSIIWTTPSGNIGTYFDGSQIENLTLQYSDSDIFTDAVVTLVAGALPTGLTVSDSGIISGYITPNPVATVTLTNYSFTLRVTNGITSDVRTFSLLIYARSAMTADNTFITADNTFITADIAPIQPPIITTPTGSIGSTRSDNFYAFEFTGLDFAGNAFEFIATTTLPPGLTLDPVSGWLYGYIPFGGVFVADYTFDLIVQETDNPLNFSEPYTFSLTISGPVNSDVIWLTPQNEVDRAQTPSTLGFIDNGATSTFYVEAVNVAGISLQYRLLSGSDSQLPQGLQLLPSGLIAGRVSFDTFCLDGGSTVFDVNLNTVDQPTTFDLVAIFTVTAFNVNGLISVNKTFSITVVRRYETPYNNLYIQAMPPQDDRDLLSALLQNPTIFPPSLIYRKDDPNFGVARQVIYNHAYGLTAATLDEYVTSLNLNHYWKNLLLGQIETAQALDDAGNILYEVVYSKVIDNLVNNQDQSVDKQVVLGFPINRDTPEQIDSVYPNSLENMRDQVIDVVGQVSRVLPRWMLSPQSDGRVLGFVPAWVIAYVKPGQSGQIAYNIQTQFDAQLNLVDFKADRYELDGLLSHNWDPNTTVLNIANIVGNGNTVTVTYAVQATAPAQPGTNITIAQVNPSGYNGSYIVETCTTSQITFVSNRTSAYVSGGTLTVPAQWAPPPAETSFDRPTPPPATPQFGTWGNYNSSFTVFTPVAWVNTSGDPVVWTNTYDGEQTVFDGNSLKFIAPVDMYIGTLPNSQIYDKYLLFPKQNILE
jgi:hypothetical protein